MRMYLAAVAALLSFANPAASADLGGKPYRPPRPIADPIEPAFKWTGFYLGAHGGIITDGGSVFTYTEAGNFEPANRPRPTDMQDEFLYGLHGGYLHQYRSGIVVGGEGSVTFGGKGSLLENPPPVGNDYLTTSEMGPTWAITGRLGYAWDRFLVYGKAGYAWTDVDFSARFFNKDGPGGTNGIRSKSPTTSRSTAPSTAWEPSTPSPNASPGSRVAAHGFRHVRRRDADDHQQRHPDGEAEGQPRGR